MITRNINPIKNIQKERGQNGLACR